MYNYELENVFREIIKEYKKSVRSKILLDKKLPSYEDDFLLYFLNIFNYKAAPNYGSYSLKTWFKHNSELVKKTQESFDKIISEMIDGIKKHELKDINLHDRLYVNLRRYIDIHNNIPVSFFRFFLIDEEYNYDTYFNFHLQIRLWRFDIYNVSLKEYLAKNSFVDLFREIDEVIDFVSQNFYFINNYLLLNNSKSILENFYYKPDTEEASLENYERNQNLLKEAKYDYIKYVLNFFK